MMRKFLFATAALIALAGPAIAADMRLPVYKAAPVVPVWSWSGCYVGGHAGGLWAKSKDWIVRTPGGAFYGQSLGEHPLDSWLGGAQAGCDYQFAGGFVIGIQGDYAWTNAEGSHDSAREIGVAYHSKVKSLAALTGRIGYAWDRLLGYVRGGVGARRVLGNDDPAWDRVYGARDAPGLDHRYRRRVCLHQCRLRLRRI
jgi:outer membrane immunogenic protein